MLSKHCSQRGSWGQNAATFWDRHRFATDKITEIYGKLIMSGRVPKAYYSCVIKKP
jgi:hypothetical protein